jgi:hypothetical protein
MPLPCWFDRRGLKQHGPGPITGPQRLVVNQQRREWLLFARFVTKLPEDGGKLGVHFLLISSVKFGRSLAYGDMRRCRSSEKKSRLSSKLVSVFDQDVLEGSWLFGHYLLVVGIRLFVKNSKCITNNRIFLEKEWDFLDFWDSPCNNQSSELNNVIVGQDATRKRHVDATDDCIPRRHRC